jgi:MFS family permease
VRAANALLRYARSFTGFERDARIFLLTTITYGIALSLWWVDFNLYLTALGFDPAFIGISGTVWSLAGVLVALPVSMLSDRLGRRIVLAVGAAGSAVAVLGLTVFTDPLAILIGSAAMGAASQTFFVLQSPLLMEHSRAEHRSELFSLQAAIMPATNIGAALLGGLIAAVVGTAVGAEADDPAVYRVLLLTMAIAAGLATATIVALRDDRPRRSTAQAVPDVPGLVDLPDEDGAAVPELVGEAAVEPDRPATGRRMRFALPRPTDPGTFWRLLLPTFLMALGAGQVIPFLNVFIEGKFGLDLTALNVIFAITGLGTVMAMLGQPALAKRFGKVGSVVLVQGVSIPFLVILGFSPVLWTVILAMTIRTSLMNAGNPIASAFAMERLPSADRATYAATASLLWSLGWALAGPWYSVLQATLGFDRGYAINFVTVIVLYSLATVIYWRWFHGLEARSAFASRA